MGFTLQDYTFLVSLVAHYRFRKKISAAFLKVVGFFFFLWQFTCQSDVKCCKRIRHKGPLNPFRKYFWVVPLTYPEISTAAFLKICSLKCLSIQTRHEKRILWSDAVGKQRQSRGPCETPCICVSITEALFPSPTRHKTVVMVQLAHWNLFTKPPLYAGWPLTSYDTDDLKPDLGKQLKVKVDAFIRSIYSL